MMILRIRRSVVFPLVLLALLVLMALAAPALIPWDPLEIDLVRRFDPPSLSHPLGCDHLGRDVLARLVWGARTSLGGAALILVTALGLGLAVGTGAGYWGGRLDGALMRLCDAFLTLPAFVLALFMAGLLGNGMINAVLAVALTHWAWYARIVRSLVVTLRRRDYIAAAQLSGSSPLAILRRHVLPPVLSQLAILASADLGQFMLHLSGLSFLGLGVAAPTPEWGVMIADGRQFLWSHPELMAYPGIMIFLAVWSCSLLGDRLRDGLDPALISGGR